MTRILAHFLKPGGKLLVVDAMDDHEASGIISSKEEILVGTEEGGNQMPSFDQVKHILPHQHHHGISSERMRAATEGAGLQDFVYDYAYSSWVPTSKKVHVFIATATKPIRD
jgi:hypothetical protein